MTDSEDRLSSKSEHAVWKEKAPKVFPCLKLAGTGASTDAVVRGDSAMQPPPLPQWAVEAKRSVSQVSFDWLPGDGVRVFLVLDSPDEMVFVSIDHLESWGVSKEDVLTQALINLAACKNNERCEVPDEGYCAYSTFDGYDATRILLPSVRRFLCQTLNQPECIIGIPNRDFLIAMQRPLASQFAPQIREDSRSRDYPLTAELFVAHVEGGLRLMPGGKQGSDWELVELCAAKAEIEVADDLIRQATSGSVSVEEQLDLAFASLLHNPHDVRPHNALGILFFFAGANDMAIHHMETVLSMEPDQQSIRSLLGAAYFRAGRHEDAIREYESLRKVDPVNVQLLHSLGSVYVKLGRITEAIDAFEDAVNSAPGDCKMHGALAAALQKAGRQNDAIRHWRKVTELCPDVVDGFTNLAIALYRNSDYDDAVFAALRAIQLDADNADGHCILGYALLEKDHTDQGWHEVRQAARLGHPHAQETLRSNSLDW